MIIDSMLHGKTGLDLSLQWAKSRSYEVNLNHFAEHLEVLCQYECWNSVDQVYAYLAFESSMPLGQRQEIAINFLACLSLQQESSDATKLWLGKVINTFNIQYNQLQHGILSKVVEEGDALTEVFLLEHCVEIFQNSADIEGCLERLSMLYDKKLHQTRRLEKVNRRILQVNPNNLKALKYFKMALLQSGEWEEAVTYLRRILKNARNQQEKDRTAQELASVLLYHLDNPNEALNVLDNQSTKSQLDSSALLFEAYNRLNLHQNAINLLDSLFSQPNRSSIEKSILCYKKADLLREIGHNAEAIDLFKLSIELDPRFFESYEKLIDLLVKNKNWSLVGEWLEKLSDVVADSSQKDQLKVLLSRLQSSGIYAR